MYSRARKLPHCNSDLQTLHKQLNNDFQVQEYLHQHQIQHNNSDLYASLLNSLVLNRRHKLVKLNRLKIVQHQPQKKVVQTSRQQFDFRDLEEKTGKEYQIKKNLQRQIVQIKKSLNLLKGDIGHLVLRNQSSQLLGSKVNKARIVAEDQLKRVALALAKDREQIKLRNQMQKKFNKKLKNVQSYEGGGLGKAKNHYIEGQIRKEEAYKKLLSSQLTAQNGQEMAKILTIMQRVDANTLEMQQSLIQLGEVANHFSISKRQFPSQISALHNQIQQYTENLNLTQDYAPLEVEKAVKIILQEYHNNQEQLRAMSQFYESQLKMKQELKIKLSQCQQEQNCLREKLQLQILQNYQVSEQQLAQFNINLKKFCSGIKTLFAILIYIEKYLKSHDQCSKRRHSSLLSPVQCSYVTQLHNLYQLLIAFNPPQNVSIQTHLSLQQIDSFYESMLQKVKEWLKQVKFRYMKSKCGEVVIRKPYIKPTTYQRTTQLLQPIPSTSLHNDSSSSQMQQQHEGVKEVDAKTKAKRIKLLEDVDINYYKMIKNTMKMQKQNTRKNYEFLRTWKRAKYASRDQILQEKRFQASFSVLFTSSNLNSPQLKNLKTNSSNQRQSRSSQSLLKTKARLSKTVHGSTLSTLKPKQQKKSQSKPSTPCLGLKKVRSNILQDKDQKSRLTLKLKKALDYS